MSEQDLKDMRDAIYLMLNREDRSCLMARGNYTVYACECSSCELTRIEGRLGASINKDAKVDGVRSV